MYITSYAHITSSMGQIDSKMVWKDTWPWDFSLRLVSQGVFNIPGPKPAAERPEMQLLRYSKYILVFLHPSVKSCIQVPGPTGPAINGGSCADRQ